MSDHDHNLKPYVFVLGGLLISAASLVSAATPDEPAKKNGWSLTRMFQRKDKEKEAPPAAHLVGLWTDTVLYQPGRTPTRGLGGRVYFYDREHNSIPVDGELVVYAFDDTNGAPNERPADRKFVYTAEHLPAHLSESDFGPSYSIWLPWDAAGGGQKELSIVPVFRARTGAVVVGQLTRHVLPGPTAGAPQQKTPSPQTQPPAAAQRTVRQVNYESSQNANPAGAGARAVQVAAPHLQFRSTTINLPPSTQQMLTAPTAQDSRTNWPRRSRMRARPWLQNSTNGPAPPDARHSAHAPVTERMRD